MSVTTQIQPEPSVENADGAGRRSDGFDLLRLPGIRAFVRWRGFPYVFQAAMLAVFLALAIIGWGRYAPPGIGQKLYAQTNLATLLVWGIWWPAMVWIAVLFGRAWCMVCPLELVSNVSERVGRRLGLRQRSLRPWISSGAIIVFLYALIQFLVAGAEIRRVPAYTSLFLIGLLAIAAISGLLFKDRAFCRAFCPVGLLLNAYGRGGMLAVRAGSGAVCQGCTGKGCIRACNRQKADGRSCPSLLNPPKLNSNRDCLVCGQCIKVCEPDNMRLLLRRPFPASDARDESASWPMTLFIMLVSGFVIWELTSEWAAAEHLFLAVPTWVNRHLPMPSIAGYVKGFWAMVVVPLAVWLLLGGLARLRGDRDRLGAMWRRIALPMAVVVAGGHMSKGLAKFVAWVGFLPPAILEPGGTNTAMAISSHATVAPQTLLPKTIVSMVAGVLILGTLVLGLREARLAGGGSLRASTRAMLLTMALLFLALVAGWGIPAR